MFSLLCVPWNAAQFHATCLASQVLCDSGYSSMDIITTLFRVTRNSDMVEFLKLEYLKVGQAGLDSAACQRLPGLDSACKC